MVNEKRAKRGRPRKLDDEFLARLAELARSTHRRYLPLIPTLAAAMTDPGGELPAENTVRWWLAQARKRGFLIGGELMHRKSDNLRKQVIDILGKYDVFDTMSAYRYTCLINDLTAALAVKDGQS